MEVIGLWILSPLLQSGWPGGALPVRIRQIRLGGCLNSVSSRSSFAETQMKARRPITAAVHILCGASAQDRGHRPDVLVDPLEHICGNDSPLRKAPPTRVDAFDDVNRERASASAGR